MIIPGYSAYDIDEHGNIVDIKTGKEVKRHNSGKYYWVTILPDNKDKNKQVHVHVLMALAFCGPKPEHGIVRFVDGDSKNIHVSNITWTTRTDIANELKHNLDNRKPRTNNCCNEATISMLYETMLVLDEPVPMVSLAEMLNVPYSVVRYSMYGLIAAGKARAVRGGYELC